MPLPARCGTSNNVPLLLYPLQQAGLFNPRRGRLLPGSVPIVRLHSTSRPLGRDLTVDPLYKALTCHGLVPWHATFDQLAYPMLESKMQSEPGVSLQWPDT